MALEIWLQNLGAQRLKDDPSCWRLLRPKWFADIQFEQEDLRVTWEYEGQRSQCCFSYGFPRIDVETAITQGPN